MNLRRIGASVAASAIALGVFTAPANAQPFDFADEFIAGADCTVLDMTLETAGVYEDDHATSKTTRSELAANLRDVGSEFTGGDPMYGLLGAQYAGKIADRALECGSVAADPAFGSSDIDDIIATLQGLSS